MSRNLHTDLAKRLRGLAFHWRKNGFPSDADVYDLAAAEIERLTALFLDAEAESDRLAAAAQKFLDEQTDQNARALREALE